MKFKHTQKGNTELIAELKAEVARKDGLLQQSFAAIDQERRVGEEKCQALITRLERASECEREAEDARRAAYHNLNKFEKDTKKKLADADALITSLRSELSLATELVGTNDNKFRIILSKLSLAESELVAAKETIFILRRELDSAVARLRQTMTNDL